MVRFADNYSMSGETMILVNGGLRSLIATATALSDPNNNGPVLVHFRDGRFAEERRAERVRMQADHFGLQRLVQFQLPALSTSNAPAKVTDELQRVPMFRSRTLANGLALACEAEIERLVWPVQFDADFDQIGATTEQIQLLRHSAQLENTNAPTVETPLIELTDQQLVELGGQLSVPWNLAWSCLLEEPKPCNTCAGCRRRMDGFAAAGMQDRKAA